MSFELISKEKNVAKVKLTIPQDAFEEGIKKAYGKNRSKFNIPGFRKGKAPLNIIENRYGKEIFYEDALDEAFPEVYGECIKEGEFKAVAAPVLISVDKLDAEGAVVTIDISLKPEFDICEYKGIKVGSLEYTLKDEDVENRVKELQEKDARLETVEDTPSVTGDTVIINFEGFVDGVAFDGGKGEDYPLVLGSNTFIPGFEDQLVGKKAGEKVDVNVKFPEEYHAEELAGKDAVFKCEVKTVQHKILPEADDEFAIDLGYENLEEMKRALADEIVEKKNADLKNTALNTIMNEIIEKTEIDLPPMLVKERTDAVKDENDNMLLQRGIDPEAYYRFFIEQSEDKDEAQFMKVFERQAIRELKTELVTERIIETEKIELSDEELDNEIKIYADSAQESMEEFKKTAGDYLLNYIAYGAKQKKMFDLLLENADKTE